MFSALTLPKAECKEDQFVVNPQNTLVAIISGPVHERTLNIWREGQVFALVYKIKSVPIPVFTGDDDLVFITTSGELVFYPPEGPRSSLPIAKLPCNGDIVALAADSFSNRIAIASCDKKCTTVNLTCRNDRITDSPQLPELNCVQLAHGLVSAMSYARDGNVLVVAVSDVNGVVITGFHSNYDDRKLFIITDTDFSLHSPLSTIQCGGEEYFVFVGQALDIDATLPCQVRIYRGTGELSRSLRLERDGEHIFFWNRCLLFCRWQEGRIDVFNGKIQVKCADFDAGIIPFPSAVAIWKEFLIAFLGQDMSIRIPLKFRNLHNLQKLQMGYQ